MSIAPWRIMLALTITLIILLSNAPTAIAALCSETSNYAFESSVNPSADQIAKQIATIKYGVENLVNCCSGDHPGRYLFAPSLLRLQRTADDFFAVNKITVDRKHLCGTQVAAELDPKTYEDSCTFCKFNSDNKKDDCKREYIRLRGALKTLTFGDGNDNGVVCVMNDLINNPKSPFAEIDAARNLSLALYAALGSLDVDDPSALYSPDVFGMRR